MAAQLLVPRMGCRGEPPYAATAVPLQHTSNLLGAVCVFSYPPDRPFGSDEIDALAALAEIAAALLARRVDSQAQEVRPVLDDLRRELTLIVGYMEILSSSAPELPSALRKQAARAVQAAWRAARHINRIRHEYRS